MWSDLHKLQQLPCHSIEVRSRHLCGEHWHIGNASIGRWGSKASFIWCTSCAQVRPLLVKNLPTAPFITLTQTASGFEITDLSSRSAPPSDMPNCFLCTGQQPDIVTGLSVGFIVAWDDLDCRSCFCQPRYFENVIFLQVLVADYFFHSLWTDPLRSSSSPQWCQILFFFLKEPLSYIPVTQRPWWVIIIEKTGTKQGSDGTESFVPRQLGSGTKHLSPSFRGDKQPGLCVTRSSAEAASCFIPSSEWSPPCLPWPSCFPSCRHQVGLYFPLFKNAHAPFTHSSILRHSKKVPFAEKKTIVMCDLFNFFNRWGLMEHWLFCCWCFLWFLSGGRSGVRTH